jgi:ornithine cyclodeaminase/alanine dehydrogenase-like protein (mu-crystallin family)
MAPQHAVCLSVIGTGLHAVHQVAAAVAVRRFDAILVHSGNPKDRCEPFLSMLELAYGIKAVATSTVESAVRVADVLICSSPSRKPLFAAEWLKESVHIVISTCPDDGDCDQLPAGLTFDIVATDSVAQLEKSNVPRLFKEKLRREQLIDLSAVVSGSIAARIPGSRITVFCSVGLAAVEVALGALLLDKSKTRKPASRASGSMTTFG